MRCLDIIMNWVSRYILLAPFMCLFLLFSCGSSHKTSKSEMEITQNDSVSESLYVSKWSSSSLANLITTVGSYVIDFRVYDTQKPPDSLTGKRPVLADGQIKGGFNQKEEMNAERKDSIKIDADRVSSSNVHEKSQSEIVKDKKESTLLRQLSWICVGIAVLLVVVFIVRRSK